MLVGADSYWNLVGDHIVRGDGPTAVSLKLGYLLSGPLPAPQPHSVVTNLLSIAVNHDADEQDLQKFWTVEDAGVTADNPDKKFLDCYSETHITRQDDGSYSAMFPWREDHPPLPDNLHICLGRTRSLVHRLAQSPAMLQTCDNILKTNSTWGFIELVKSDGNGSAHYIPHHMVKKSPLQH